MQCVATAAFSLEGAVKRELIRLGVQNARGEMGAVRFEADEKKIFEANLWLRSADRVLIVVGEGKVTTFEELFQLVKKCHWADFLPRNAAFPVSGKCARSTLMSVRDCQAITKKAIVEAMKSHYKMNWCPEDGPKFQIDVSIHQDIARLTIDTSGDALNKRGYRTWNGEAPLRETMAASLVGMSPWRPFQDTALHDPCCGTGTLLIEAAMIQADRAPGLKRSFAIESWPGMPKKAFEEIREEAFCRFNPDKIHDISGSDIDPEALKLCKRHIVQAGLGGRILVYQKDLKELQVETEKPLCFIANPPYGERLSDKKQCEKLYRDMRGLYNRHMGSRMSVVTAHTGFERCFGMRAQRKHRLYNGRLECEFLTY